MGTIRLRAGLKFAIATVFLLWTFHLLYSLRFAHDANYGSLDFRVYYFSAQLLHGNHHADLYAGALNHFPLDVDAPPRLAFHLLCCTFIRLCWPICSRLSVHFLFR